MARLFLGLSWDEYKGDPLSRCRFFGVLPLKEPHVEGLKEEEYLFGRVRVLSREGRKAFFSFAHYVPSGESARNALLRYAFFRVAEGKGWKLKGRLGEVLVFEDEEGRKAFVALKWGGYAPAGLRRLWEVMGRYVVQTGGRFLFLPKEGRKYGKFRKAHPQAEPLPKEFVEETLSAFEQLASGAPAEAKG